MRSNLRTEKSGSPYYRALCGGWQMGRKVCVSVCMSLVDVYAVNH